MRQETDYILRMIEQIGAMIRGALEKLGLRKPEEIGELGGQALGLVLSMEPDVAAKLMPASLVSLLELTQVDERVMALLQQALEIEAGALEDRGDLTAAMLRRDQAEAVRRALEEREEDSASAASDGVDVSYTSTQG